MPIRKFIKGKMELAEIKRLNLAYAKALRALDLVDRIDPVTRIVAEKVIKVGTSGVTDPEEIADTVVGHFHKTWHTVGWS